MLVKTKIMSVVKSVFIRAVFVLIGLVIISSIGVVGKQVQPVKAATGVPEIISYQGRLYDSTGSLLGGSGTNYYFRFSIWDSATGGTKLWPTGTPSTMTYQVRYGVFNAGVGDISAGGDSLTLDFNNDAYYLQVEVASLSDFSDGETLSPRQRITSSGYAKNADTIDGYHASTTPSTNQAVVLNSSGNLEFGTSAPTIQAQTGLTLQTTVSGDINLSPAGQVKIVNATTTQLTVGYDSSNYFDVKVASDGGVTFDAVGSGAEFIVSDNFTVSGQIFVTGTATSTVAGDVNFDSNTLYVDSINNRVGIRTMAPTAPLEVTTDDSSALAMVIAPNASGNAVMRYLRTGTSDYATFEFANGSPSSNTAKWGIGLRETGDNNFHFYNHTAGQDQMIIEDNTGNVGIATTTPAARLHVIDTSEQLRLGYDANNYVSYNVTTGGDLIMDSTGGDFYIASGDKLHVSSTNLYLDSAIALGDSGSSATDSGAYKVGAYDEFANSNSTNVQAVLNDLDAAISSAAASSGVVSITAGDGLGQDNTQGTVTLWAKPGTGITTSSDQIAIDTTANLTWTGGHIFQSSSTFLSLNAVNVTTTNVTTTNLYASGTITGNLNPQFTQGSVVFQGASGLAQDNSNFYWDDTNNRLGIGTTTPTKTLHVSGDILANNIRTEDFSHALAGPTYIGWNAGGQEVTPSTGTFNTFIGASSGDGNTGSVNAAVGVWSAAGNTGTYVSGIGSQVLNLNTGSRVQAVGRKAAAVNSGSDVIAVGFEAAINNSANNVTAIGYQAGASSTGAHSVLIGYKAGFENSTANAFILRQNNINTTPLLFGDFSSGSIGVSTSTLTATFNVEGTAGTPILNIASSTGASALYIDEYGQVGIGTTSPGAKLEVNGGVSSRYAQIDENGRLTIHYGDSGGDTKYITLENTYGNTNNYHSILFKSGDGSTMYDSAKILQGHENSWTSTASTRDSYLSFFTSNNGVLAEKMRITSSGNVGIATTSPTVLLTVGSSTPGSIASGNYYNSAYVSGDLEVDGKLYTDASTLYVDADTTLGESTSATDSGAYKVGVYDEFANSNSTNVQAVLNDLDAAITSAAASSGVVSITAGDGLGQDNTQGTVTLWAKPGTGITTSSDQIAIDTTANLSWSGTHTFSNTVTTNGTLTANGAVNLGNGADNLTLNAGTGTFSLQSSGIDITTGGVITNATWNGTTVSVPYGGTGATTLTANGILYGNGTSAIQATAAAANSILATNASNVPSLTQTLPVAVQGNITQVGTITSGVWNGTAIDFGTYTNATASNGLTISGDNIQPATGYTIPLTASTTNWNTFYDTPSNRITAGSGLNWSGNTLNVVGGSGSNWSYATTYGESVLTPSSTIPIWAKDTIYASSTLVVDDQSTFNATSTINSDLVVDTNTLFVDSANNRVGIGTGSPGNALVVSNSTTTLQIDDLGDNYSDGNTQASLLLRGRYWNGDNNLSFSQARLRLLKDQADGSAGSSLAFDVMNAAGGSSVLTERMRINSSGNVGIATTTPQYKLTVAGDAMLTGALYDNNYSAGSNGDFLQSTASGVQWTSSLSPSSLSLTHGYVYRGDSSNQAEATSTLYIADSGNVGIGTTGPGEVLTVKNTLGSGFDAFAVEATGGNTFHLFDVFEASGGYGQIQVGGVDGVAIQLASKTSVNSYINAGNVGIGTTSPTEKLYVNVGASDNVQGIKINQLDTGEWAAEFDTVDYGLHVRSDDTGTIPVLRVEGNNGATSIIEALANGNVGIATSSPLQTLAIQGTAGTAMLNVASSTGASVLYVDEYDQVGIGTNSPNAPLTVVGKIVGKYDASGSGISLTGSTGNNYFYAYQISNNGYLNIYDSSPTSKIQLAANDDTYFNGGNVGIGTTSPGTGGTVFGTSKLHVYSSSNSGTGMTIENTGSQQLLGTELLMKSDSATRGNGLIMYNTGNNRAWGVGVPYSNSDAFQIGYVSDYSTQGTFQETETLRNTNSLVTVKSNGNVGIATTTPTVLLTVGSSTPGSIAVANQYNSAYVSGDLEVDGNLYTDASTLYVDADTTLGESTSATDSGAYKVGVYDEFANSNSTNVQAVLNDLDAAITSAAASSGVISITAGDGLGQDNTQGTVTLWAKPGTGITTSSDQIAIDTTANLTWTGGHIFQSSSTFLSLNAVNVTTTNVTTTNLYASGTITGNLNPQFTQGSVVFQGASGLAQDNSNFYWDDTNNRLGIGTASPGYDLDISGNANITGYLRIVRSVDNYWADFRDSTGNRDWRFIPRSGGSFVINDATAAADRVVIDSSGNVGVNSSTPFATLAVEGTAAGTKTALFKGASSQTANIFEIQNAAGTSLLTIDPDGLASFTASTSTAGLVVNQTGTGDIAVFQASSSAIFTIGQTQVSSQVPLSINSSGDTGIAGNLIFTNPTAAYIKSDSPLYIQSGDLASNESLYLSANNAGVVVVEDNLLVEASSTSALAKINNTGDVNSGDILELQDNGTNVVTVDPDGDVSLTQTLTVSGTSTLATTTLPGADNLVFTDTNTTLGESTSRTDSGAYKVGVNPDSISNSASTSLQFVLEDLDSAITSAAASSGVISITAGDGLGQDNTQGTVTLWAKPGTGITTSSDQIAIDTTANLSWSGTHTFSNTVTTNGTLTANGAVNLGNGADNLTLNAGTGTFSLQSSGIDITTGGVITNATWNGTTVSVPYGGTGATTLTANGILYGNGSSAIQATAAAANSILATNASNVPSLTQTLPVAVQGNITQVGTITSGVWNGTAIDFGTYTNATASNGLTISGDNIQPATGYTIPLTASTTNWNTFYDTPSTRITAGSGLNWSGNTLNVVGGSGSNWSYATTYGESVLTPSSTIPIWAKDTIYASSTLVVDDQSTFYATSTINSDLVVDTNTLFVDSFNNRVGIGTTTPQISLHIAGSSDSARIRLTDDTKEATIGYLGLGARLGIDINDGLQIRDTSDSYATRFIIDSSGNVGIATTTPTSRLTIQGSGATSATYGLNVTDSSGAPSFVVRDDGNVGIGTASPTEELDVNGNILTNGYLKVTSNTDPTNGNIRFTDNNPYIYAPSWIGIKNGLYVVGGTFYASNQAQMRGGIHNDTGAYLTIAGGTSGDTYFSGNVGIATTTPQYKLTVAGDAMLTGALYDNNYSAGSNGDFLQSTASGVQWTSSLSPSSLSLTHGYVYRGDSSNQAEATSTLYIADSGNVGIGTTGPQATLDLGSGTSGRSLVWGGPSGTNWYGTLGTMYSSADLFMGSGLKLDTTAGNVLYSYTGTQGASGVKFSFGSGDISFANEASSAKTAGNVFDHAANTKMIIKSSGKIGIGTTTPQTLLTLSDSLVNNPAIEIQNTYSATPGKINLYAEQDEAGLSLTAGAKVGTWSGTNVPTTLTSQGSRIKSIFRMVNGSSGNSFQFGTAPGGNDQTITWNMVLNNDSKLGIGTTSPTVLLTVGSSTPDSIASGNYYNSAYVSGDLEVDGNLYTDASTLYVDADTTLGESTSATDSGAYKVGAYDEFANSNSTNVQAVLNDLDAAISSAAASSGVVSITAGDGLGQDNTQGTVTLWAKPGTGITTSSDQIAIDTTANLSWSGTHTFSNTVTTNGTLTANGAVNLGNGADNLTLNAGTGTFSLQSSGIDITTGGVITNATWNGTTVSVPYGGTGATTLTANGILYGNGSSAIQATAAAANSILATNASNVPSLTQTLPVAVQGNITQVGTITSGVWNGTAIDFGTYTNATASNGLTISGDNIQPATGYTIPLTASTTNWNTFYDTPSTRITAGNYIDWSGNTLNVTDSWYNAVSDIPLTNGYVLRGSSANVAEATSSLFIADSGNVGIGTTSPQVPLHISGTNAALWVIRSSGDAEIAIGEGTGANQFGAISWNAGSNQLRINTQANPSQLVLDNATGNVGIGTTGPSSLLHISSNTSSGSGSPSAFRIGNRYGQASADKGTIRMMPYEDASGGFITIGAVPTLSGYQLSNIVSEYGAGRGGSAIESVDGNMYFHSAAGATYNGVSLSILNNGNVGIGTTGPNYALDVVGQINSSSWVRGTIGSFTQDIRTPIWNTSGPDLQIIADNNNDETNETIRFGVNSANLSSGTEWMRIMNGNVGIGTTTPTVLLTVGSSTPNNIASGNYYNSTYISGDLEVDGSSYLPKLGNLTSNGFVKTSGSDGTLSVDTSTYLTGNQTITLSGDVSGSGATAITTTIGNDKITEAMLKAVDTAADEECLTYEATVGDFEWQSCGGGGTPGGSDGQIQYNNGGSFGGASALYYDDVNSRIGIGTTTPQATLSVQATAGINSLQIATSTGALALDFTTSNQLRVYDTAGTNYVAIYHDGTNGNIDTSSGALNIGSGGGDLRVYDSGGTKYLQLTHDGTNGLITASVGNVDIGTAGNDVLIGAVGTASNLVFEESSVISGQGGNTITLGVNGDRFDMDVSGVTYNVGTLTGSSSDITLDANKSSTTTVAVKNTNLGAVAVLTVEGAINTGVSQVGGSAVAYNKFGAGTPGQSAIATSGDVYIAGDIEVDGTAYLAGGTAWTQGDLAEEMSIYESDIQPGDVVVVNNDYTDPESGELYMGRMSYQANSNDILGVISTAPAGILKYGVYGEHGQPIVLTGTTPVKVTTENGPIRRGDQLTTASSTPGAAMKATTEAAGTIGMALEDYVASSTGYISVLINLNNKVSEKDLGFKIQDLSNNASTTASSTVGINSTSTATTIKVINNNNYSTTTIVVIDYEEIPNIKVAGVAQFNGFIKVKDAEFTGRLLVKGDIIIDGDLDLSGAITTWFWEDIDANIRMDTNNTNDKSNKSDESNMSDTIQLGDAVAITGENQVKQVWANSSEFRPAVGIAVAIKPFSSLSDDEINAMPQALKDLYDSRGLQADEGGLSIGENPSSISGNLTTTSTTTTSTSPTITIDETDDFYQQFRMVKVAISGVVKGYENLIPGNRYFLSLNDEISRSKLIDSLGDDDLENLVNETDGLLAQSAELTKDSPLGQRTVLGAEEVATSSLAKVSRTLTYVEPKEKGAHVQVIGIAKSTSELLIQPSFNYTTYKDGYLQWDFGNVGVSSTASSTLVNDQDADDIIDITDTTYKTDTTDINIEDRLTNNQENNNNQITNNQTSESVNTEIEPLVAGDSGAEQSTSSASTTEPVINETVVAEDDSQIDESVGQTAADDEVVADSSQPVVEETVDVSQGNTDSGDTTMLQPAGNLLQGGS